MWPPFLCRYVLECSRCGVIYRSRQYWMGNQDPESGVVRSEVKHVWEGVSILHPLLSNIIVSFTVSQGVMLLFGRRG